MKLLGTSNHAFADVGLQVKLKTRYCCLEDGRLHLEQHVYIDEKNSLYVTNQFTPETLRAMADKIEREMQEWVGNDH